MASLTPALGTQCERTKTVLRQKFIFTQQQTHSLKLTSIDDIKCNFNFNFFVIIFTLRIAFNWKIKLMSGNINWFLIKSRSKNQEGL